MPWIVNIKKKAMKKINNLPKSVQAGLKTLIKEIEIEGPVRGNWPNYGRLPSNRHHCHLKKGHPTYVAIWKEGKGEIQLVEVIYAGTHEKAPY
jgi:mRNA-degrading endonuclease RelE of RelBE toxin-antitoxin system